MKRKIPWLLLSCLMALTLVAGCGGISQAEYDAAVALRDAAQEQLTLLQNQLDTLQNDLDTAEDDLDAVQEAIDNANAEIAFLEALIVELEEAAAEAEQPAVYTNSDYGFSLEYPKEWAEKPEGLGPSVVVRIGEGVVHRSSGGGRR